MKALSSSTAKVKSLLGFQSYEDGSNSDLIVVDSNRWREARAIKISMGTFEGVQAAEKRVSNSRRP
jgi:hypothetical protein